ncbi:hypothetical protein WR25_14337 isoform F [Diploscapter pachys]|nr:hypothetical protein WR25_14337 isoform B [Diploscapter pachys]PAV73271.1 hypothetical protein WR25_14337 isoform C [Diploscapter pachys]PAV73274.1 hypothetical protein WR25_14337 isoform F [Diploscapter pachys]
MGFVSFLVVSLGGLAIGLILGFLTSFITKYTEHVRVVEPVFLFGLSYLSYILGELFHLSGIIALISCGLVQTHYAMRNLSYKSNACIMYFTKVISNIMESMIFIILGVMLVNERGWFWSDWHPLFSVFSIVLCVVVRFIVVYFLTYIINRYTGGVRHVSFQEQFIIAYGGLRGAISFSLAFMIDDSVEEKNTLLAATYMVILFTVFIQGSSIKLLVKYLKIQLAGKNDRFRLFLEFNHGMIDNLSQGIEDLCGYKNYSWINICSRWSRRFLRPFLQKNYTEDKKGNKLAEMDKALNLRDQMIASSSTNSFSRQATIDEMAESGINVDLIDDEEGLCIQNHKDPHRVEEIEKATDELTKDSAHIRALMNNPFEEDYLDRNLVNEADRERRQFEYQAKARIRSIHDKMLSINKYTNKKKLFGRKSTRRGNTQQGMLMAAIGSIGVHAFDGSDHTNGHDNPSDRNRACSSGSDEPITMVGHYHDSNDHELYTITEGQDDQNSNV